MEAITLDTQNDYMAKKGSQDCMKLKGVSYDAGRVMYLNWRPDFDPKSVGREIEIIKNDLHCNAIRIGGLESLRIELKNSFSKQRVFFASFLLIF